MCPLFNIMKNAYINRFRSHRSYRALFECAFVSRPVFHAIAMNNTIQWSDNFLILKFNCIICMLTSTHTHSNLQWITVHIIQYRTHNVKDLFVSMCRKCECVFLKMCTEIGKAEACWTVSNSGLWAISQKRIDQKITCTLIHLTDWRNSHIW